MTNHRLANALPSRTRRLTSRLLRLWLAAASAVTLWALSPVGSAHSNGPESRSDAALQRSGNGVERAAFYAEHEIRAGDRELAAVALSFDCGYGPDATRRILDTLAAHGVSSTFFLEGRFIEAYPDLVVRMAQDGHELANHSQTHRDFRGLARAEVGWELSVVAEALRATLDGRGVDQGSVTEYFRFPYGARDETRIAWVAEHGYQSVFWTLDPKGWRQGATADAVATYVLERASPGDIVIQHCNSWADARALPRIVRGLRAKGLAPTSITGVADPADLIPSLRGLTHPGVKHSGPTGGQPAGREPTSGGHLPSTYAGSSHSELRNGQPHPGGARGI